MKEITKNLLLVLISLVFCLSVLELVIFRHIFLASDLPILAENIEGSPLKFVPDQTGTYRLYDEIAGKFSINENGWNSVYPYYDQQRTRNRHRICLVGDSFVEALQVNVNESIASYIEKNLSNQNLPVEVYRFGISGAPLSHYVYMIENEIVTFNPDLIIVNLVHNDFNDSVFLPDGTYSKSLASVKFDHDGQPFLEDPEAYVRNASWWVKRSAIFRYLWVRMQIRPDYIRRLWQKITERRQQQSGPVYSGNVDASRVLPDEAIVAIDYLFSRLKTIQKEESTRIMVVMDGNRSEIQNAIDEGVGKKPRLGELNKLFQNMIEKYGFIGVDLSEWFYKDYYENRKSLLFENDGHWNKQAHSVAGTAVSNVVVKNSLLSGSE